MLFEIFSDHIILVWMNLSLNCFFVNVANVVNSLSFKNHIDPRGIFAGVFEVDGVLSR